MLAATIGDGGNDESVASGVGLRQLPVSFFVQLNVNSQ